MVVQLAHIVHAQQRLAAYLSPTPLEAAPDLGAGYWLKLENTNRTHSFKIRGALNAVLALEASAKARGIIAASSGNHAQGVAYAAHLAQTPAQILMPLHTPQKKINGVKRYGAEAVLFGENYDETEAEALRRAREAGLTYLSPYNDAEVIAGAGTIGLEIAQHLPDVARVVVCISGGGLISGIATALTALKPAAEIIGVCAQSAPAVYNAFYGSTLPENWDTLAEALSGSLEPGSITVPIVKATVDRIVLVSETQIAEAMRWLLDVQGWLVEGGGSVGVAAALAGLLPDDGKPTVLLISGGNVDLETVRRILC